MTKQQVRRDGSAYYTDDAEYVVSKLNGVTVVRRGDGSYKEFATAVMAHDAAYRLAAGLVDDSQFDWQD